MQNLKRFLGNLEKDFHQVEYLSSDPLEFVHQYGDPWDQEVVALVSAVLAYGNVKQIRRSVAQALERMSSLSSSPSEFVRGLSQPKFVRKAVTAFETFVHRFNRGHDVVMLLRLLEWSWSKYGSLGGHFLTHLNEDDADFGRALSSTMNDWNRMIGKWAPLPSFSYLLTSPADGSCCKRWCMLLRWMGRQDRLDPGLWTASSGLAGTFPPKKSSTRGVSALKSITNIATTNIPTKNNQRKGLQSHQLVMPLDTHTGRISQYLGLTSRKALNWKAAIEVTESLKKIDPKDPIRYDFALARLGILDLCQRKYRAEVCQQCQLVLACKFAQEQGEQKKRFR